MFVMNYPDNRRGTRQTCIAKTRGDLVPPSPRTPKDERIKIYVAGKVGTARKQPIPVIDINKFSGDGS